MFFFEKLQDQIGLIGEVRVPLVQLLSWVQLRAAKKVGIGGSVLELETSWQSVQNGVKYFYIHKYILYILYTKIFVFIYIYLFLDIYI